MTGYLTIVDFSRAGGTVQIWVGRAGGDPTTAISSFDPQTFHGGRGEARRVAVMRGKELADILGVEFRPAGDEPDGS